jgi:crotonobetainyl-CoA:carnitine CoA-transferase CaiB-like acyl-CoA transferase
VIQPYDNIRIVDFTTVEQGPVGTQVLADFGAEVIKVERLSTGDMTRGGERDSLGGLNPAFAACNRNKKSVTVNLKTEEGKQLIYDLVKVSDVVASNFRPGVMERLGFGFEELSKINPRIIVAYASGYGQTGPYRERQGQDLAAQSIAGLASMTGFEDSPPAPAGYFVCDFLGGMLLAQGIMAALAARERTGRGQVVDSCLLNAGLTVDIMEATNHLNTGKLFPRPKRGFAHPPGNALYAMYECADGRWVSVIGSFVPDAWATTCKALDIGPPASTDERFLARDNQEKYFVEMQAVLAPVIKRFPRDEIIRRFESVGMLAAPINDHAEAFADPQVLHNDMVMEIEHPQAGNLKLVGIPVKLSDTPGQLKTPPPLLGQHNTEIFTELLGRSPEQLSALQRRGVVGNEADQIPDKAPPQRTEHSMW